MEPVLNEKKTSWIYKVLRWLIWLFSPKYRLEGTENLPDEPCVIVGNHSHMYGPIVISGRTNRCRGFSDS